MSGVDTTRVHNAPENVNLRSPDFVGATTCFAKW